MKYHLIGIKGVGMTAIAQVLKSQGHDVTGSDTEEVFFTDDILKGLGIKFFEEFKASHVTNDIDGIIKSPAYLEDNIEVKTALEKKIDILDYPEALGEISENYFSVAVCGTHGKTTQSAILSILAQELGFDPLCIIGSSVPQFGNKNARTQDGESDLFIAEVCEYKKNFLNFSPDIILLPSLDYDHVDYFKTKEDYEDAFIEFICRLPEDGVLVAGGDQVDIKFLEKVQYKREDINIVRYGFGEENDIIVTPPVVANGIQTSNIQTMDFEFSLSVPGRHNILNSTGAFIVMDLLSEISEIEIADDEAQETLLGFKNTKRRMEKLGEYNDALLFDDYAHHPVEIEATIESLKSFYSDRNIRVIFQSHTFSRSKCLELDFAESLKLADEVILTPIYPSAREIETKYTSEDFADTLKTKNSNLKYFEKYEDITKYLEDTLQPNDIAISMGAGDTWRIIEGLLN